MQSLPEDQCVGSPGSDSGRSRELMDRAGSLVVHETDTVAKSFAQEGTAKGRGFPGWESFDSYSIATDADDVGTGVVES